MYKYNIILWWNSCFVLATELYKINRERWQSKGKKAQNGICFVLFVIPFNGISLPIYHSSIGFLPIKTARQIQQYICHFQPHGIDFYNALYFFTYLSSSCFLAEKMNFDDGEEADVCMQAWNKSFFEFQICFENFFFPETFLDIQLTSVVFCLLKRPFSMKNWWFKKNHFSTLFGTF